MTKNFIPILGEDFAKSAKRGVDLLFMLRKGPKFEK